MSNTSIVYEGLAELRKMVAEYPTEFITILNHATNYSRDRLRYSFSFINLPAVMQLSGSDDFEVIGFYLSSRTTGEDWQATAKVVSDGTDTVRVHVRSKLFSEVLVIGRSSFLRLYATAL